MLAQIDGFQAVGELHHLWQTRAPLLATDELCGCGSSYADCRFWPGVIETALGVGRPGATRQTGAAETRDRSGALHPVDAIPHQAPRLCSASARIPTHCSVSLLGHREHLSAAGDRRCHQRPLEPLLALHPSRARGHRPSSGKRPRGVAFSWAKRIRRPEFRDQHVYMPRQTSLRNATYWSYSNFLAGRSRRLHQNYILLRYEDFIRRPTESLRKICTVLGEEQADLSFLTEPPGHPRTAQPHPQGKPFAFCRRSPRSAGGRGVESAMPPPRSWQ